MPAEEEEEKGGCLVGSSSSKRQRFYIELKPGETAIVSWKKLLRDARKIDQCPAITTVMDQSSYAHKTLDDNSNVGQRNNSFLRDERLGHKTKARFSDNKQLMVPMIKLPIEGKKNDGPTRKFEDCKSLCRLAVANAPSMLQKHLSPSDTSYMLRDQQLEGLHDVPVMMYSKKSSTYCGKLNRPSPVNVAESTSVIPLKTKHDILQQNQRLSDIMSQSSARRFTPLQTYRRSKNLVDGRKGKVQSMALNDDDAAPCQKRKVTDTGDHYISNPSPCREGAHKKVPVERPSLLSKSSHYAKSIKFKPSREGNLRNVPQKPQSKEPRMEVTGKTNVKIRFHLKSDHETRKSQE